MLLLALTQLAATEGLGVEGDTLFAGYKPSRPHQLTCLFEYDSVPPPQVMGPSAAAVELSGVQVLVRAGPQQYPWGDRQVRQVRSFLAGLGEQTVVVDVDGDAVTVDVVMLVVNGGINPLGRDGNDCPEFSANLHCWWRPS